MLLCCSPSVTTTLSTAIIKHSRDGCLTTTRNREDAQILCGASPRDRHTHCRTRLETVYSRLSQTVRHSRWLRRSIESELCDLKWMSTPTPPSYEAPSFRRLQSMKCFLTEYEEDARTFLAKEETQVIQLVDLWLDAIPQPKDQNDDSVDIPTTGLDHSSCSMMHGIWLPIRQFSDTLSATAQMPIAMPLQDVKPASGLPSASKPLADLHDRASELNDFIRFTYSICSDTGTTSCRRGLTDTERARWSIRRARRYSMTWRAQSSVSAWFVGQQAVITASGDRDKLTDRTDGSRCA